MGDEAENCYKGLNPDKWLSSIKEIIDCHNNLFPKVLDKGQLQEWIRVHKDYPKIDNYDKNKMTSCIEAFNFINVEERNIDTEKANTEERRAMEYYQITKNFIKIIENRHGLVRIHDKLIDECDDILNYQFDSDVQMLKIEHQNGDNNLKTEMSKKIMERAQLYKDIKAKIKNTLKVFKTSSKTLAEKENLNFDEKFNKNQYLNYFQFTKNFKIDDESIDDYFKHQEKEWLETMKYLSSQASSEAKINSPDLPKESELQNFQLKMKKFTAIYDEAENVLTEAGPKELETYLKRIQSLQDNIYDYQFTSNTDISENSLNMIKKSRKLMRKISERIEEIHNKSTTESENKKQEIQSNLRTMQAIKLMNLTGPEDWIPWKKSQKHLNTHTDPFKKGAALQATLKNPLDIEMCKGIHDFDIIMTKLNDKYNHGDKIVSALKKQLEKLPTAFSNQVLLKNIRLILNVYQQLKDIEAEGQFDGTTVNQLKMKFSEATRLKYEEFVREIMRSDKTNIKVIDEDGNIVLSNPGVKSNIMDIKIPDKSPEIRKTFLAFIREQAVSLEKAGVSEEKPKSDPAKYKCAQCKQNLKYCKCKNNFLKNKASVYNVQASNVCPCCQSKEPHKGYHGKETRSLGKCPKFQSMTYDEKRKFANKVKACYVCLVPGHTKEECRITGNCFNCGKSRHHPILCTEPKKAKQKDTEQAPSTAGDVNIAVSDTEQTRTVITPVRIKVSDKNGSKFINTSALWDPGANVCIIEGEVAEAARLKGKNESLSLTTCGETKNIQSKKYDIELIDNENKSHKLEAYSLEHAPGFTTKLESHKMNKISKLFNIPASHINNAEGKIGLIIGMKHFNISPFCDIVKEEEQLTLFKSKFGKPYVLGGRIPGSSNKAITTNEVYHIDVKTQVKSQSYWDSDSLGLNTEPKCSTCLKAPACKACKLLNQPLSFKEQEEGKIIKESMSFDLKKKEINVSYPYIKNVNEIFSPEKSNKFIAEKMANNLMRSLKKDNLLETYTESFMGMIERGAAREISQQEMDDWESKGNPINYCSHHAVLKDSKSTACRSVCNSSLSHNNTSLNAMLPKGPTALSNLLHVQLRYREKAYVVIGDLSKAYNSVKTSVNDMHLRRLLWYRKEDLNNPNAKLRTFGMMTMAFGDTPAQYILECAKEEVCNYVKDVMNDEKLANDILAKSYVDDIAISLDSFEEAKEYKQKLPKAFESYGFKIKEIFIGGVNVKQEKELEKQLLFGHIYDPNSDLIILKFVVNFSSKKRSQKTEPNLTSKSDLAELKMTKRKFMSLLSSQYDPMGLASPFLAKFKIFLARLFKNPDYDWDVNLNDVNQKQAIDLVRQMIFASENSPKFKRSNKPEGFKLKKLIVFVDASTISLQVVVYGLYTSKRDEIVTSLITAKNKITQNTVPRNELQSLLAGHRLVLNCQEALDETIEEICFVSDSTCTLDSLGKSFISKDIFIINRVSEMRRAADKMNCNVKYYHIESKLNVADKGTREDCKFEYLSSKEWQEGPEFIKDLDSKATLKFDIKKGAVSHEVNMINIENEDCIWTNLLERSSNLKKLLRVYCKIKSIFQEKTFKVKRAITIDDMHEAFLFFIKFTQSKMKTEKLRTKQLVTFEEDGIIYTKMRFQPDIMIKTFGKDKLPVIPGKSKFAKLLLLNAHSENIGTNLNQVHNSIHQTLVNSRVGLYGCYITYAKQNIKGIVRNCTNCRRLKKIPSDAKMSERKGGFGEIPPDGSAFNKIAIDYFGPFRCKTPKGRETKGTKFYRIHGMAVLCQQTRAVKFYPVEGYDTSNFLNTFKIHCSMHGVPTHVLSDPMSAFIAGAKLVGNDSEVIDFDKNSDNKNSDFEDMLEREYNIKWEFIPPGSQWRDPAERSIKSLKEMMQSIFNTENHRETLSLNEYWCIFSECAEILNRRPIEGYIDNDTLSFICPNQLILGRTSKDQPIHKTEVLDARPRLELIENIKCEFWKKMLNVLAADSKLMKYPCWYSQSREPKVGDIILVLYKSKVKDHYRIGKIKAVDNNKRDLTCSVSPIQNGSLDKFKTAATMKIPVQRTILLCETNQDDN